ncbi:Uncharacterized protein TCM_020327 [Theobroma cacao]|uniref:Uncharacterized protein n=1 Tax=Theobroma cacao TaxID=3641 RepID=A0A061EKW0_THECC|nr:Uncharacterized protein TCM_020327 [Theobroma cacao]
MNPRCPVNNKLEMPTFLASTLGSIGLLRISDGPVYQLIVFACPTGTMATYVRAEVAVLNEGRVARITACLRPDREWQYWLSVKHL